MMRFFGFLFFVALALGAWGYHKEWFTVHTSDQEGTWTITTEVHKQELGRDLDAYERKVLDALDALDRKIDDLRNRARTANAKSRPAIQQELEEEERKKGEATELLRDLKEATPEQLPERQKRVDDVLDGNEPPLPLPDDPPPSDGKKRRDDGH